MIENRKQNIRFIVLTIRLLVTVFLIAGFVTLQNANGQSIDTIPGFIKQKFIKFTEAVPREEVYLSTDREDYVAGEDLWFNTSVVDRKSMKPSINSRIVYVELLNPQNRPVAQKRILLENGTGPGQFILADTLSSGTYTIRAYTNWMKNFLPYNCFMKDISVYNSLSDKPFRRKVTDRKSKEKTFNIALSNDGPVKGILMEVNNQGESNLGIVVKTDAKYSQGKNDIFYILIQSHGNVNYSGSLRPLDGIARVQIPQSLLSGGINQITLFNSECVPLVEKNIFTPSKEREIVRINSADAFGLREKIILDIDAGEGLQAKQLPGNISVSVTPATQLHDPIGISDYLLFGTEFLLADGSFLNSNELKGITEKVADSIAGSLHSNWIDWSKILSTGLPKLRYQFENENHMLNGKLLNSDDENAPSSGLVIMCSPGKEAGFQYAMAGDDGRFTLFIPANKGVQDFIIMPERGDEKLKIRLESSFSDTYFHSEMVTDSSINTDTPPIADLCVNYQVRTLYGEYAHEEKPEPVLKKSQQTGFYGKPDIGLRLSDYITLPTMQEVFFELLPNILIKKKNPGFEFSIADRIDDSRIVTSPCIMIDGVMIKDASLILNLDPELVEKIDVITGKYVRGSFSFPGLVNVITRAGDFSCVPLPSYMIRSPYRAADKVMSFRFPDYLSGEVKKRRVPDFRSTLYWNPSVPVDKNGKGRVEFWSSDATDTYVINIQGIGDDGRIFSARKVINVRKNR